jgi:hypothetical protein
MKRNVSMPEVSMQSVYECTWHTDLNHGRWVIKLSCVETQSNAPPTTCSTTLMGSRCAFVGIFFDRCEMDSEGARWGGMGGMGAWGGEGEKGKERVTVAAAVHVGGGSGRESPRRLWTETAGGGVGRAARAAARSCVGDWRCGRKGAAETPYLKYRSATLDAANR